MKTNQIRKPRICITTRIDDKGNFYLRKEYAQAVSESGGIAYYLPLIPTAENVLSISEDFDGLLLPGSDSDVNPLSYSQEPIPACGHIHTLRDEMDLLLLDRCEVLNKPVLAICYGVQILNVSRGGTLIQDIQTQIPSPLKHSQGEPRDLLTHYINFENKSLLRNCIEKVVGEKDKILVNSHHHQSVDKIGRDLMITARASDGVVEALEDTRPDRYVVGVQWHPELTFHFDEFSKNIFGSFITAASEASRKISDL
ncbi:MAG: gamma-glutamyl-gamma-aminobutyrate hydrolase family protein [Pyrinomonadaceae bacterium]|nr:gamma-glutamyl-gamma-aminobutyrate hydrolase family protein [Pyrinomonadaceae bacterium]